MAGSRIRNTLLSSSVGVLAQVASLLLSFVVRTVFIHYLNVEYLGINGLYSNILTLLSLSELGMSNVMIFSLYKPVAERNEEKICQLLSFYKRLYNLVAFGVLGVGLLILPFLPWLVDSTLALNELRLYYVLFLLNSVFSYFVVYRSVLLKADQKLYVTKLVNLVGLFVKSGLQIVAIAVFRSFVVYLVAQLIFVLLENVTLSAVTTRMYPYVRRKGQLPATERGTLYRNIYAAFTFRIGTTIVNNTDNILMSVMVNTAAVGYYSNYSMIVTAVTGIMSIFTTSVIPSVGNLNASEKKERAVDMIYVFTLIYHVISAYCAISFLFLFNRFIPIWLGAEFVMDSLTVAAIALNFYVSFIITPIWMYREACGLFGRVRYLMLCTAGANLVFSILGGRYLGVAGILLATALARICTTVWYEPIVLLRRHYGVSVWGYWSRQLSYLVLTTLCGFACWGVDLLLPGGFAGVLARAVVFGLVCVGVFGLFTSRTKEFQYLSHHISRLLNKRKKGV